MLNEHFAGLSFNEVRARLHTELRQLCARTSRR